MVSFQCDGCADTVKKPKLDQHRQRCHAPFTCLDCSTTFHGQEYKSHTSCITEAEKYQGALYKGPKKGQNAPPRNVQVPPAPAPAPTAAVEPPQASSSAAATIHPSRLQAIQDSFPEPSYSFSGSSRGRGRGAFGGRGGRGGAGAGAGAGGRSAIANGKSAPSGENRSQPAGGMRSWGTPDTTDTPINGSPAPAPGPGPGPVPTAHTNGFAAGVVGPGPETDQKSKKKNKRKGDKGGTGSKANSNRPRSDQGSTVPETTTSTPTAPLRDMTSTAAPVPSSDETAEKPKSKKRKMADTESPAPAPAPITSKPTEALPEKSIKRLRKNLAKLDASSLTADTSFSQWLEKVGKSKKDMIGAEDVMRGLKVGMVDGKWVLSI